MESQPIISPTSQDARRSEDTLQDEDFHAAPYSDLEDAPSQAQDVPPHDEGGEGDATAITDAKVALVVAALTLTSFLVMLDMSILPTVGTATIQRIVHVSG